MKRKWLAIGLLLLLTTTIIIPVEADTSEDKKEKTTEKIELLRKEFEYSVKEYNLQSFWYRNAINNDELVDELRSFEGWETYKEIYTRIIGYVSGFDDNENFTFFSCNDIIEMSISGIRINPNKILKIECFYETFDIGCNMLRIPKYKTIFGNHYRGFLLKIPSVDNDFYKIDGIIFGNVDRFFHIPG